MLPTHLNVGINNEFKNVSLTCSQQISSHSVPHPPSPIQFLKKIVKIISKTKKGYPVLRNRQSLGYTNPSPHPNNMNNRY